MSSQQSSAVQVQAAKRPRAPSRQQPGTAWKWLLFALAAAAVAAAVAVAVQHRDAWQGPLLNRLQDVEARARAAATAVDEYVRGPLLLKALAWKGSLEEMALDQRYVQSFPSCKQPASHHLLAGLYV